MNKATWAMLNDAEKELLRTTEPGALGGLGEDELADLHDRVRRARNKYSKLYRRRAGEQVRADASRAGAHDVHARTLAKAEAFEDALARVSRSLARAASQAARELREERLAAARKSPAKAKAPAKRPARKSANTAAPRAKAPTPASKRSRAQARATKQRTQAKRDSR